MVSGRQPPRGLGRALLGALTVAAALAGSTCKVVNEDHCVNQDLPGNTWCRELNSATPYCSPCRRNYHGCVDYEPFACAGYDAELGTSGDGGTASSTAVPTGGSSAGSDGSAGNETSSGTAG